MKKLEIGYEIMIRQESLWIITVEYKKQSFLQRLFTNISEPATI